MAVPILVYVPFCIIGMLMVVALPTIYEAQYNYDNTPSVTAQSAPKTQPLTQPQVQVPNTKDGNRGAAPVSAEISNGEKVFPKCGQSQKIDRRVCWSCGQPFDN